MQPLVRKAIFYCALACAFLCAAIAASADEGSIAYTARVVHHNRDNLTFVRGEVDLASGDFCELIDRSYLLNWKQVPGQITPTRDALPSIWQVGGESCQRYDGGLPRFNSPLLRHFLVSKVISGAELKVDDTFLSGQLKVLSAEYKDNSFEIVASFNGSALVVVGRRAKDGERWLAHDLAVLGPESELYQYFIESIKWAPEPPAQAIALPRFDSHNFVEFPQPGVSTDVPVLPVKNWLVFRAQLPGGRPLNLVFDSGASTMIVDDWVLKLDADLKPVGEMPVAGGLATAQMQQYEGFSFEVGGVKFKNLPVVGTQLTSLGFGADMRIHGVVGNEILQLCQLDLDLNRGQMRLMPLGSQEPAEGLKLDLTFINELPYVEAEIHGTDKAYLLLDTGQNSPLSVNLDYLDQHKLGDDLVMNGFLGDIAGGLAPRYMLEQLGLNLAGQQYTEHTVDAVGENTYNYDGVPVIGAIGFPLLARHFAGLTFDYSRAALYLRGPAEDRTFSGSPEAWEAPLSPEGWFALAPASEVPAAKYVRREAGRRPKLLPDRIGAGEDPRSLYAWAANPGSDSDPLDLVRAGAPVTEPPADAGDQPAKRTLSRESLLLLLRDTAEGTFTSLLAQSTSAAPAHASPPEPAPPLSEAAPTEPAPDTAAPDEAAPDDTLDEAASDEAASDEAAPAEDTAPAATTPPDNTPSATPDDAPPAPKPKKHKLKFKPLK